MIECPKVHVGVRIAIMESCNAQRRQPTENILADIELAMNCHALLVAQAQRHVQAQSYRPSRRIRRALVAQRNAA